MFNGCNAICGGSVMGNGSDEVNFNNVTQLVGNAIAPVENSMMTTMQNMQNNPNPSPEQLTVFQAQVQMYSTLINLQSSFNKVIGDTMKSVVSNMDS